MSHFTDTFKLIKQKSKDKRYEFHKQALKSEFIQNTNLEQMIKMKKKLMIAADGCSHQDYLLKKDKNDKDIRDSIQRLVAR